MLPDPKTSLLKAELNQMLLLLEKIKTGGWRIPPYPDPVLKQIKDLNKMLEAISKGHKAL